LQLGSAVVGLLASLIFSQFLRTVASCFGDRSRVRSVDFNLAFLGLLLGGSCGTFLYVRRLALQAEMLPWLAGGWLLCFAWHLWLVKSVRQSVRNGLQGEPKPQEDGTAQAVPATVRLHTLSGLRRMARARAEALNETTQAVPVLLHTLSGLRRMARARAEALNDVPDAACSSPA
jgi:hypothetical protein